MALRDDNDNSRAGPTEQRQEKFELLRQSIHELINSEAPIEAKASAGLRVGRYGEPALFTEGELKVFGIKIFERKEPSTTENAPQAQTRISPHHRKQSPARGRPAQLSGGTGS